MAKPPEQRPSPFTSELREYLETMAASGCKTSAELLQNYNFHRNTYSRACQGRDNCQTFNWRFT